MEGGHLMVHYPSKQQGELPGLRPRAIARSFPFLLLWDQTLPSKMRMKWDTWLLGCHKPQAQLFSAPPCEHILCDLTSEWGVQVLRYVDLSEQTSSIGAVQIHHVSPISSSLATSNCDGKAVCCTTHHVWGLHYYLIENIKKVHHFYRRIYLIGVFITK